MNISDSASSNKWTPQAASSN